VLVAPARVVGPGYHAGDLDGITRTGRAQRILIMVVWVMIAVATAIAAHFLRVKKALEDFEEAQR